MPNLTTLTNVDILPAVNGDPNGAKTASSIRLFEDEGNGFSSIGIKAPPSLAANVTLTLPTGAGTSGQFLSTDGAGVLSWATAGGGGGGGVLYNVTTAQSTATLGNELFDVAYTGTGTGNALGAFITSTSKGNGNTATGLTVKVDSGSSSSTIQGIIVNATSGAAATKSLGLQITSATSGAADSFGLTVTSSADAGRLSQALTIGPEATQTKSGWIRLNSYWEGNDQAPPDGYAVYSYTTQPAGAVTIPGSTTKGRLVQVLSSGQLGPITINQATSAGGTYSLSAGKGVQMISNGSYWIPFVP